MRPQQKCLLPGGNLFPDAQTVSCTFCGVGLVVVGDGKRVWLLVRPIVEWTPVFLFAAGLEGGGVGRV